MAGTESAASAKPPPHAGSMPAVCCACGYRIGAPAPACPECGWDVVQYRELADQLDSWGSQQVGSWRRSVMHRHICVWLMAITGFGLGAGALGLTFDRAFLEVAWWWMCVPLILVATSWEGGARLAALGRRPARAGIFMCWRRELWRLHVPWLAAPVYIVAAILLGLIDKQMGADGWLYWCVPPVAWLPWSLTRFVQWARVVHGGPVPNWPGRMTRVLGAVVFLPAWLLGVVTGFFVMVKIGFWLGVGPGPWTILEALALGSF